MSNEENNEPQKGTSPSPEPSPPESAGSDASPPGSSAAAASASDASPSADSPSSPPDTRPSAKPEPGAVLAPIEGATASGEILLEPDEDDVPTPSRPLATVEIAPASRPTSSLPLQVSGQISDQDMLSADESGKAPVAAAHAAGSTDKPEARSAPAQAQGPVLASQPASRTEATSAAPPHGPRPGEKKHYFDHKANVEKVLRYFYIGCVILVLIGLSAQFLHWPYHPHSAFDHNEAYKATKSFADGGFETSIPGFYCLYGFVACTVLVICATQLRKVLMRREDYYDV